MFLVGLAVILALTVGVATTALGANGQAWILGKNNVATAITRLAGAAGVDGPMLQLINNDGGTNDTALALNVQAGEAPMKVNSNARVANLNAATAGRADSADSADTAINAQNADKLDGQDFSAFQAQGPVDARGPLPIERSFTSNGGILLISVSGSGFRSAAFARMGGAIGVNVLIDGSPYDSMAITTNARDQRQAFVSNINVIRMLPSGSHTLRLEALYDAACNTDAERYYHYCTTTNDDDRFNVTVLEIPETRR